jgi:hypothetical protein
MPGAGLNPLPCRLVTWLTGSSAASIREWMCCLRCWASGHSNVRRFGSSRNARRVSHRSHVQLPAGGSIDQSPDARCGRASRARSRTAQSAARSPKPASPCSGRLLPVPPCVSVRHRRPLHSGGRVARAHCCGPRPLTRGSFVCQVTHKSPSIKVNWPMAWCVGCVVPWGMWCERGWAPMCRVRMRGAGRGRGGYGAGA